MNQCADRAAQILAPMILAGLLAAGCGVRHELDTGQELLERASAAYDDQEKASLFIQAEHHLLLGFRGPRSIKTAHCGYLLAAMYFHSDPGISRNIHTAQKFAERTAQMLEVLRAAGDIHAAALRDTYHLLGKISLAAGSISSATRAQEAEEKYQESAAIGGGEGFRE